MDIRMPGMGGLAATTAIKEKSHGKGPVIIGVTASAFDKDRAAVMDAGADDFISKPFQADDILGKIQEHMAIAYQYASVDAETAQPEPLGEALSAATLETLPATLRQKLRDAVLNGQMDRLTALVQEVADHDARMAGQLKELVDAYQYNTLITLFQEEITS